MLSWIIIASATVLIILILFNIMADLSLKEGIILFFKFELIILLTTVIGFVIKSASIIA